MLFNEAQILNILHLAARHQIHNCITKPANLAKEQDSIQIISWDKTYTIYLIGEDIGLSKKLFDSTRE